MKKKVIIEFKDIEKKYKKNIIHNKINLKVFEGETLAILGSNGAGKTQLLKILVSLVKQDGGSINYSLDTNEPLDEIAMQFQEEKTPLTFKTKDLIKFVSILHKDKIKTAETDRIIEILGVDKYLNTRIKKLSGGQKQRLNLLLALIRNTKILVLDEFTNSLDIPTIKKILDYIAKVKKERNLTIIMVTHQPEELRNLSERMVLLKNGLIENEFNTKDIEKKYKGNFTEFLMEYLT